MRIMIILKRFLYQKTLSLRHENKELSEHQRFIHMNNFAYALTGLKISINELKIAVLNKLGGRE